MVGIHLLAVAVEEANQQILTQIAIAVSGFLGHLGGIGVYGFLQSVGVSGLIQSYQLGLLACTLGNETLLKSALHPANVGYHQIVAVIGLVSHPVGHPEV